jgi:hypothetical protein
MLEGVQPRNNCKMGQLAMAGRNGKRLPHASQVGETNG